VLCVTRHPASSPHGGTDAIVESVRVSSSPDLSPKRLGMWPSKWAAGAKAVPRARVYWAGAGLGTSVTTV
jgi:hypothetical protein